MGSIAVADESTGFVALTDSREQIRSSFEGGELKSDVVAHINAQVGSVPGEIMQVFGNDKFNIYVRLDDGTVESYWARTEKNLLKEIFIGAREDADAEIKVREDTVDRIVLSKNPAEEFVGAVNSGEIEYNGISNEGKIESIFVKTASAFAGVLGAIWNFIAGLFGN